ncbi:tetratricopeptide repeat protein [Rhodovarius crocodyli]|uniref:Tetratricopeptide repeat protein n=1 Tax=Rhodovarius crocodyli TaxID=1979269 RepID=A0A437MMJ1_9PROT|nr:cellulose synthase subunit BcsC-related outer membrane protein [Rhodovarius crocodyli]RVT98877.1 tetratricopeptide repeat protein [Rhodovarius crocodyli]
MRGILHFGPLMGGALGLVVGVTTGHRAEAQPATTEQAAPAATSGPVVILIRQAERWLAQNRADLAASAIERALSAEPRNTQALAVAARVAALQENRAAAAAYEARLREAGASPELRAQAESAVRGASIDRNVIEQARALAREGRNDEAVQRYRAAFGQAGPIEPYTQEYYAVLSGTTSGRGEATQGLQRLAEAPNAGARARLAFAQNLTFNATSRAEGIRRLSQLVDSPEVGTEARAAWRQALVWSASDPAMAPQLDAYMRRFPDDAEIRNARAAVPAPAAPDPGFASRREGFERLEGGSLRDATRQFEAALAANPNDADALGGMGIVRLREGKPAEARTLLERAIALAPDRARNWQGALDGASYGLELAQGRAALRANRLDEADNLLRTALRREVQDRTDAESALGELLLRRNDPAAAEQRFRAALARRPGFPPAQQGLNQALRAQGRAPEGPVRSVAAPSAGPADAGGVAPTGGEAGRLRAEAARLDDPGVSAALLRQASEMAPTDPWIKLDLARALRRQGRGTEARQLVEDQANRSARRDDFYAAALLADEDDRPADAEAWLARIPPASRTADMSRLSARLRANTEVQRAVAQLGSRAGTANGRTQLLTLAARPDPSGGTGAAVIRALGNAGDRVGAGEAARVAEAANRNAGASMRLALAGALLSAGLENEAAALADSAEGSNPTADQRRDIVSIRQGIAIRSSDRLNQEGRQAQAFEALRPVLERDAENPGAQLALARLYQGARQPAESLRIAEGVLARNPRDISARQGAIDAAIALRDRARAERLLSEAQELSPRDSRVTLMEARVARAFNQESRALRALELAGQQRQAELGRPTGTVLGGGTPGTASQGLQNPFASAATPLQQISAAPASNDPVQREIAQEVASMQQAVAAQWTASAGIRQRSGQSGLDRLLEISAPVSAEITPGGIGGRLTATVTGVSLQAGNLPVARRTQDGFGSNAAYGSSQSPRSSASGAMLGIAYQLGDHFRMDIGSSPLGFAYGTQVLGGIEFAPQLGNVRLRVTGERRSVTDSMLSWAGQRDAIQGRHWGQVVRSGGRAQIEVPVREGYVYAGGGYSIYEGEGVADNNRFEAGAGFSYPFIRGPEGTLTGGLDLVYFGFERNLRFFSLGHGGYYSPQSFAALNLPVDYRSNLGDLRYRIGATVGYAAWRENSSPIFPTDPTLQGLVEARARTDSTVLTRYAGQSRQNFIGNLRADLDYPITSGINVGASVRYDKSANWDETRVMMRLNGRF